MNRKTRIVPPGHPQFRGMAGGQDLVQVLQGIDNRLQGLAAREQAGEDVAAERDALEREKAQIADAQRGGATTTEDMTELQRLRAAQQETTERAAAREVVEQVLSAQQQEERDRAERMRRYAAEEVSKTLAGGALRDTVGEVLRDTREPSRAANEYTTPEAAAALAAGTGGALGALSAPDADRSGGLAVQDRHSLSVQGISREAKSMVESKSFVTFFKSVLDMKDGWASEAQRQFLLECRSKAMAEGTDTAGGFLVHPEWMADILPLLRAQAVVLRANPRQQPFAKQMNQTSVSAGAAAFYTLENARIPTSELTLAEAPLLTPKNLTAMVPISRYLLEDASPEAEQMIRDELAEVLALRGDLAFLQGTGTGGEPLGFKNVVGVTSNPIAPGANGFQPTLAQFRRIVAALDEQNGQMFRPVWFFNPKVITYLNTLQEMSGGQPTGRLLSDAGYITVADDRRSGVFDGIPYFATNQIPTNITLGTGTTTYALLVNMAEAIVGLSKALEVAVSTEASYTTDGGATWQSAFQQNQALFRAIERHDIAHRRPSQIIVQNGILY